MEHLCWEKKIEFGREVISNPFGPLQDKKIAHFLAKSFMEKQLFEVKTPDYIRDFIHVRHLALAIAKWSIHFLVNPNRDFGSSRVCWQCFEFANLFYNEFSKRLGYTCKTSPCQMKFEEPVELTNKTSITNIIDNYDTNSCWDELIKYYDM